VKRRWGYVIAVDLIGARSCAQLAISSVLSSGLLLIITDHTQGTLEQNGGRLRTHHWQGMGSEIHWSLEGVISVDMKK